MLNNMLQFSRSILYYSVVEGAIVLNHSDSQETSQKSKTIYAMKPPIDDRLMTIYRLLRARKSPVENLRNFFLMI